MCHIETVLAFFFRDCYAGGGKKPERSIMKHVSLWSKKGGRFNSPAVCSFNLSENPEKLVVVARQDLLPPNRHRGGSYRRRYRTYR